MRFNIKLTVFAILLGLLSACSSNSQQKGGRKGGHYGINYKGQINDSIMAITLLSEQQHSWAGVPYVLGGNSRDGADCSGFVQTTFLERFNIELPRMTVDQVKEGEFVDKEDIQTGDLVFFKTGRGPNGYHVGIYVKEDKFLHASTKGGVIYSSLESPFWKRTYWQARRI